MYYHHTPYYEKLQVERERERENKEDEYLIPYGTSDVSLLLFYYSGVTVHVSTLRFYLLDLIQSVQHTRRLCAVVHTGLWGLVVQGDRLFDCVLMLFLFYINLVL